MLSKKETILLRANMLGGMNQYILNIIGDEFVTERWLMCGIPDGCNEDELMEIAKDDSEFLRISNLWNNLIREN